LKIGAAVNSRVLQVDSRDNVLVALTKLSRGEAVEYAGKKHLLISDVPAKHKFATVDLAPGDQIVMYGVVVGNAVKAIQSGELLTTTNIRHQAAAFHDQKKEFHWSAPDVSHWAKRTFQGYVRSDGQVGTRNYWLVVPLVFCENKNIQVLKQAFEDELGFATPQIYRQQVAKLAKLYREGKLGESQPSGAHESASAGASQRLFENVDGIRFLVHEGGCGGTREDSNNLCGLLAGYIHHPNVAGATVLSLGCQHAQIEILRAEVAKRDPQFSKPLFIFEQQKSGSESAMMRDAIEQTFLGLVEADKARRSAAPLSKLCVGLKCGGSDGFSGISANPAIGHTSDLLATLGGRTILSEFPELCGVEQNLIDRGKQKEVGDRFMQLMNEYAARAAAVRSAFEMNPSPGNMRDGLLTDAMKSAGAAKKGGTSPVTAVLDYPEYSREAGLNLQCTPGNDVECVTAQVGAGASVVMFTTGLGTPTGNPIAPVVKISTNSVLAQRMADIIDIDTGPIIDGQSSIEEMGEHILDYVIQLASGETRTKAEEKAQEDFIPWKRGVSL
jgi:altronate hydrolase